MINIQPGLMDGFYTKLFRKIYIASSSKPLGEIKLPKVLDKYWEDMCEVLGQESKIIRENLNVPKYNIPDSKKIMIGFSGGKDSLATAIYFLNRGYDVTLFYVQGINRSYPHELDFAKKLADRIKCELVVKKISVTGKCDYIENPTKNQYILAMMVDEGIKRKIKTFSFGNIIDDTMDTINSDYMLSDGIEMFENVLDLYCISIEGFELINVLQNAIQPFIIVTNYDKSLWNDVSSCVGAIRYKNNLRTGHNKKYGVELLEGRCGSCYKCAQEAYILNRLGVTDYSDEYISHCVDVMKKWNKQLLNADDDKLQEYWLMDSYVNEYLNLIKENKDVFDKFI